MKKSKKILAVLLICALLLVPITTLALDIGGGGTIIGGDDEETERVEDGFANASEMIKWTKEVKKNIDIFTETVIESTELSFVALPGADSTEHPEYRVMDDSTVSGGHSTADWIHIENPIDKSWFINKITVGAGIDQIGANAFTGETKLSAVVIDPSLKTIKSGAFSGCDGIKAIYFNGSKEDWAKLTIESDNGVFNKTFDELKTAKILKDRCDQGNHIPSENYSNDDTYHWKVCTLCGKTISGSKKTHDFGDTPTSVTTAATCTEDGESVWTCSVCKKTEIRVDKKLGHDVDYVNYAYDSEKHYYKCIHDGCDYVVEPQYHSMSQWSPDGEGFEKRYCLGDCGYTERRSTAPILGDVNSDHEVTAEDADILSSYIAKLITSDKLDLSVADTNKDGKINVSDCVKIMLFVNKKITVLE